MKVSIRRLLTLSMALICIFGAMTGATFWYSNHFTSRATDQLIDAVESVAVAQNLQMNLSIHRRQSLLRDLRSLQDRKDKISESQSNILQDLSRIPHFSSSPDEDRIVQEVQTSIANYLQQFQNLRQQGFRGDALFLKLREPFDRTQEAIQNLIDINLSQTRAIEAETESQNRLDSFLMAVTLLLLFSLIAIVSFAFRKLLYKPVLNLKQRMDDFELGSTSRLATLSGASEVQEIAQSFESLRERLFRQKEQQLTFLASIAHDLKNPLGAIKMSAEILSETEALNANDKKVLSIISRQSDHMRRLVNDLLDTTRIESGHLEFHMAPVDICRILQDSVVLHSNLSSLHNLRIEKPAEPLWVLGDEQRLTQVINNLLSNAIKYSPSGGTIRIMANSDRKLVSIAISDPGLGISSEDLKGIFEPFRRSPSTQKLIPGVGLGLSVSKKIIEAHAGGSITVFSEPGKGSTFIIRLNLYKQVSASAQQSSQKDFI